MKSQTWVRTVGIGLSCLAFVLDAHATQAATLPARAIVARVTGIAEYRLPNQSTWRALTVGMALAEGLAVRTYAGSSADFALTTKAIVRLSGSSEFQLDRLALAGEGLPGPAKSAAAHTRLTLQTGTLMLHERPRIDGSTFVVNTPIGPVSIQGQKVVLSRTGNEVRVRAIAGSAQLHISRRVVSVGEGQEFAAEFDPVTGEVNHEGRNPVPAPQDDAIAQNYRGFEQETQSLVTAVLTDQPVVDLELLLQGLKGAGSTPIPTSIIVIGNPGPGHEVSPSSP